MRIWISAHCKGDRFMRLLMAFLMALMLTGCEQSITNERYRFEEFGEELYRIDVKTGEIALIDGDLLLPISAFPELELTEESKNANDAFHASLEVFTVGERLFYDFIVYHNPKKQWKSPEARLQFLDRIEDYNFYAELQKKNLKLYSFKMEIGNQTNNGRMWTGSVIPPRSFLQNADNVDFSFSVSDFDGDLREKTIEVAFNDLVEDVPIPNQ